MLLTRRGARRLLFFTALLTLASGLCAEGYVLSTADTPPLSTADDSGFYDRVLVEAFSRLGHTLSILHQPSGRSLSDAVTGSVDGEYARTAAVAEASDSLVIVPVPLSDYEFVAFRRDSSIRVDSWDSLGEYHVGFIDGWRIFHENVSEYRSLTLVPDSRSLFRILVAGRVDVVLYERRRGEHYIRSADLDGVRAIEPLLAASPMYLLLNADNADNAVLREPLAEVLRAMREDGTIERIEEATLGAQRSDTR